MHTTEEVRFVHATLRRLDLEIQHLEQLRIRLRRRLNQLNSLPNVLPPETLSLVFEAACAPPNDPKCHDPHFPLILASVCSHWRQVTFTTPAVWQTLAVRAFDQNTVSTTVLMLVQFYARHVGGLALSLGVVLDQTNAPKRKRLSRKNRVPVSDFFKFIFREYACKLGALVLTHVPREWWSLLSTSIPSSTGLPRLRRVSFSWAGKHRDPVPMLPQSGNVPHLTHVSLLGQRLPIELPWDQITFLELKEMNIEQCIGLLVHCPRLVEYHCRKSILPNPYVEPASVRRVEVIPYLESMSWDFGLTEWDAVLMARAHFPSLRRMAWARRENTYSNVFMGDFQESSYRTLREQFMSRLQTLTVFECSLLLWTIEDLCAVLPNKLQELNLIEGQTEEDVLHTLHFLTLGNDGPYSHHLPHLQVLSIPYPYLTSTKSDELITSVLRFLRSRIEDPTRKGREYTPLRCLRLTGPPSERHENTNWAWTKFALSISIRDVKLEVLNAGGGIELRPEIVHKTEPPALASSVTGLAVD